MRGGAAPSSSGEPAGQLVPDLARLGGECRLIFSIEESTGKSVRGEEPVRSLLLREARGARATGDHVGAAEAGGGLIAHWGRLARGRERGCGPVECGLGACCTPRCGGPCSEWLVVVPGAAVAALCSRLALRSSLQPPPAKPPRS